MNVVIFGGRSPIAIGISRILLDFNLRVWHVTRSLKKLSSHFPNDSNLKLIDINLEYEDKALRNWCKLISSHQIDGLVFSQRYRGDMSNFSSMVQCDVITPYKLIQKLCEQQKSNHKKIIFFSSPASHLTIPSQEFPYHATKAAVSSLVKYLSSGIVPHLNVNAICPSSYVFKERAKSFYEANKDYFETIASTIPSKQFTQVDDIAKLVKFLFLDAPHTLNGQEITIDGGLSVLDQSFILEAFTRSNDKS